MSRQDDIRHELHDLAFRAMTRFHVIATISRRQYQLSPGSRPEMGEICDASERVALLVRRLWLSSEGRNPLRSTEAWLLLFED